MTTEPTEEIVDAHIYVDPSEAETSVRLLAEDTRRLSKELADALWDPEGKTQTLGRLEFYRSARNELITERDQLQNRLDRALDQRDRYQAERDELQAEVHRLRNSEAHETVMLKVERDRLATRVDEDRSELACAWSDYRAEHGIPRGVDHHTAHRLFRAGWDFHRSDGDTRGPLR